MKCIVHAVQGNGKPVPPLELEPIPPYIVLISDWSPDFFRRQFNLSKIDYPSQTAYYSEDQSQYRNPTETGK